VWENILAELLGKHRGKAIGIALGLTASILFVSFGFWKTIFIAFCIGFGYLLGKNVDEEINFELWLRKIFKKK